MPSLTDKFGQKTNKQMNIKRNKTSDMYWDIMGAV